MLIELNSRVQQTSTELLNAYESFCNGEKPWESLEYGALEYGSDEDDDETNVQSDSDAAAGVSARASDACLARTHFTPRILLGVLDTMTAGMDD